MTMTKDIDSLTNSLLQDFDKTFRKNGLSAVFHRRVEGNRTLLRGMIAIMVAEDKAEMLSEQRLAAIAEVMAEQINEAA
jgi:2-hydroxychromene-2-carboxylate isomerase